MSPICVAFRKPRLENLRNCTSPRVVETFEDHRYRLCWLCLIQRGNLVREAPIRGDGKTRLLTGFRDFFASQTAEGRKSSGTSSAPLSCSTDRYSVLFGVLILLTFAWKSVVATSSKTICNAFRIVVCAAILTGSLFGPALHDLQHSLESVAGVQEPSEATELSGHSHSHGDSSECHGHSHSDSGLHRHSGMPQPEKNGADDSAPTHHQHDSSSCAICYVLSLQLDRAESVQLTSFFEKIAEILVPADEVAEGQQAFVATARGPPASV